jgi:hypothetical protein
LTPVDGPIPNTLPTLQILNEDEAKKSWAFSTPSANTGDRRLQERKGVTVADFSYQKAMEAIQKAIDEVAAGTASETTPCVKKVIKRRAGKIETAWEVDDFIFRPDVTLVTLSMPPGNWARVATRTTSVKILGQTTPKTIKAGEFIPSANGTVTPVTSIRLAFQLDANGDFVESPEETLQRMLERNYRRLDETPKTAPAMEVSMSSTAEEDEKEKEKKLEELEKARKLILGEI